MGDDLHAGRDARAAEPDHGVDGEPPRRRRNPVSAGDLVARHGLVESREPVMSPSMAALRRRERRGRRRRARSLVPVLLAALVVMVLVVVGLLQLRS